MIKNNIELDVKVKCLEAGMTQEQVATKVGTTGQYVNRVIKKKRRVRKQNSCPDHGSTRIRY